LSNSQDLIVVYEADNELDARIQQSILEDNGIPSLLQPRSSLPSAYAPASIHGAVSVMVLEPLAEQARELLASDSDETV
jgi:hypothetical protein